MYDWKAGDATGEGTYYERKMTTAYGMRCVNHLLGRELRT